MNYDIASIKRGKTYQLVDPERKVIFKQIEGPVVKQLQAMALHDADLRFCRTCLKELGALDCGRQSNRAEAFWISCITRFFKCFGNSKARANLSAEKIFTSAESIEAFNFFKALRNKHIAHDENSFSDAFVAAAINPSERGETVIEVVSLPFHLFIIGNLEIEQLRLLVDTTYDWVASSRVDLEKTLTSEYRQWTRDKLLALADWTVSPQDMDDVFVARAPRSPGSGV
jgi:hypothetical protein